MENEAAERPISGRLRYLCYRCLACNRLLTKLEILARWERMERENKAVTIGGRHATGICPCGSSKIGPTNPKWWEELLLIRVWVLWWKEVRGKKVK